MRSVNGTVHMARGEDAFTAADSLCRLQRLQATCGALRESEGVDALLFIGGIDGRDNLGSVRCLNFLLGGVVGVELLEREQCVGKWGEDVVLLVRPDECEIYVGHAHYEALRPFVAAWGNVEVHTLPPRHIPNEDDEAPKRPDREDEARDDDEQSSDESLGGRGDGSDDSEEEEEEDVLQDFKLTALVSMLTGVTTVGVACTPNGPGEMETERWPLLQAYGIEGVGRSGFFTMSTKVVDTWDVIHRACFTQLDGAQLRRELAKSTPPFRQHWEASLATMDARRAPGRMTLTPALAFDPLDGVFRVRDAATPGGVRSVRRSRRAEGRVRARHRRRSSRRRRRTSRKRQGVRVGARARPRAALHGRGEAPEEPGASMREDLRVWPGMRDRDDHQRLHQTRRRRLRKPIATSRASPRHRRGGRRRARGTLRRRGRRGPRRHVRRVRRVGRRRGPGDVDQGDAVEVSIVGAARRAFAVTADVLGVPSHVGSDRASVLDVRVDATDPSNARPSPAAGDGAMGERRGNGGGRRRGFGCWFQFWFRSRRRSVRGVRSRRSPRRRRR